MVYKHKRVSYGMVELKDSTMVGWYAITVNGVLKEQSKDFDYLSQRFDAM